MQNLWKCKKQQLLFVNVVVPNNSMASSTKIGEHFDTLVKVVGVKALQTEG